MCIRYFSAVGNNELVNQIILQNRLFTHICTILCLLSAAHIHIIMKTHMATGSRQRARRQQALNAQGAAHPHPEAVTDPLFRDSTFFDPNDLVQV